MINNCYQCRGNKSAQATMLPPMNFHLLAQPKQIKKIKYVSFKNDDLFLFESRMAVRLAEEQNTQLQKEMKL